MIWFTLNGYKKTTQGKQLWKKLLKVNGIEKDYGRYMIMKKTFHCK